MTARLETIRENRAKHVYNLQTIWNQSLQKWLSDVATGKRTPRKFSRSRYDPQKEDNKHKEMMNEIISE